MVTGSAGFIGFHLARRLLEDDHEVIGFDGMTACTEPSIKRERHDLLCHWNSFLPVEAMLENAGSLDEVVKRYQPDVIVHLAAQAGVRHSVEEPGAFIASNLVGTCNLLEAARGAPPRHLLIASSSSVYGGNETLPFSETDRADFPISLYAATKKACEAMSHSYAHLWQIPTTCFRFFTVYGPWGRPDMALFRFVKAIENGEPIEVHGDGQVRRDFTYIDDLTEAITRLIDLPPQQGRPVMAAGVRDSLSPVAPWRSVNIGGGQPVSLLHFIDTIEACLGRKATRIMLPMQQGDPLATQADTRLLEALAGIAPKTDIEDGVSAFVAWYRGWRQAQAGRRAATPSRSDDLRPAR
jgi:UDP-glucuronate 4-epimerase